MLCRPAAAQDFAYDPALLTSCLQTNAAKPDSCIGAASKVCLEGEAPRWRFRVWRGDTLLASGELATPA